MLTTVWGFLLKHKNKILAALSFGMAGYFIWKCQKYVAVSFSSFMEAVKQGKVKEFVLDHNTIFFRSEESEWFTSSADGISQYQLFKLAKYIS